jgi:hypothetical protein
VCITGGLFSLVKLRLLEHCVGILPFSLSAVALAKLLVYYLSSTPNSFFTKSSVL